MNPCPDLEQYLAFVHTAVSVNEGLSATTTGSDSPNKTQSAIRYPDGFTPSLIDATEPKYIEWVQKLMQQKIKKFPCMEAIKRLYRVTPYLISVSSTDMILANLKT